MIRLRPKAQCQYNHQVVSNTNKPSRVQIYLIKGRNHRDGYDSPKRNPDKGAFDGYISS